MLFVSDLFENDFLKAGLITKLYFIISYYIFHGLNCILMSAAYICKIVLSEGIWMGCLLKNMVKHETKWKSSMLFTNNLVSQTAVLSLPLAHVYVFIICEQCR